jgi:CubicO group peptidase (beta-lactamase class C family)
MSKSFTAMAILKLRDEGLLALSDPAQKYLPELEHLTYLTADAAPLTIFNLLTMTAGFPEDNPWGDRFLDISDDALLEQVKEGIPFSTLPSLHYEYSNLGYGLLGQIIRQVSGMPYQEYITANILHPLGME